MVTSSSVGDGFFEFLSDWDRFHLKVTPIQVVVPETRGYYLTTFDGRDVVKVMLTGTIVQVWRVTTTAPISANLHHLIREYTGDWYQGGGIYFDLKEPDSLDWLEKFIKVIVEAYLDWLGNYYGTNASSVLAIPAS